MSRTATERVEDRVILGRQWFEEFHELEGGACSVCQYPLEACGTCGGPRCHCLAGGEVKYVHWSAGRPLQLAAAIMSRWGTRRFAMLDKRGHCRICHRAPHTVPAERVQCENIARAQERDRDRYVERRRMLEVAS